MPTCADQLLVECSDPGTVVFYEETLENVLRHGDFEKAKGIWDDIVALAAELGEGCPPAD